MNNPQFTGQLGNLNSRLGFFALGYDPFTEIVVTWIGNRGFGNNPRIQSFGFDEDGTPIILELGKLHVLTRDQIARAQANGAILVSATPI